MDSCCGLQNGTICLIDYLALHTSEQTGQRVLQQSKMYGLRYFRYFLIMFMAFIRIYMWYRSFYSNTRKL